MIPPLHSDACHWHLPPRDRCSIARYPACQSSHYSPGLQVVYSTEPGRPQTLELPPDMSEVPKCAEERIRSGSERAACDNAGVSSAAPHLLSGAHAINCRPGDDRLIKPVRIKCTLFEPKTLQQGESPPRGPARLSVATLGHPASNVQWRMLPREVERPVGMGYDCVNANKMCHRNMPLLDKQYSETALVITRCAAASANSIVRGASASPCRSSSPTSSGSLRLAQGDGRLSVPPRFTAPIAVTKGVHFVRMPALTFSPRKQACSSAASAAPLKAAP